MPADPNAPDDGTGLDQLPGVARLTAVVRLLIERTAADSLKWEIDEAAADSFCCSGEGWLLAVRSLDADSRHPYGLLVREVEGDEAFQLSTSSHLTAAVNQGLELLYHAARSSALLQSPLVDRVLRDLTGESDPNEMPLGAAPRPPRRAPSRKTSR